MAINCKICASEIEALEGGRCRKCRQLVCGDCIASGSAKSPEGILCKACARAEAELDEEQSVPIAIAKKETRRALSIPVWKWIVFSFSLVLLFFVLGYYPVWKVERLGRKLESGRDGASAAAVELVRIGGDRSLRELKRIVLRADPVNARLIAIDALGDFPGDGSLLFLQGVVEDKGFPEELRLAAKQAIARKSTFLPESSR